MRQSAGLRVLTMAITLWLLGAGLPGGDRPTAAAPLGGGGGQSWSIAGTGFVSADSGNTYRYQSGGGVKITAVSGPWPFMTASVELPDGAVINALTLYYFDSDATADVILFLQRSNRAGGVDTLAGISSNEDGTSYATDNSITNGTVDNGNYHYSLSAELDSANVILYGARIDYTPPAWTAALASEERPLALSDDRPLAADPALGLEAGAARYIGGQVVFLAPPTPDLAGAKTANVGISAGPNPLAVANPAHWKRHTIPGSTFHPINSGTGHAWSGGGGRHVTTAPPTGVPSLVAPLDLINGKIMRQVKFTYYDVSPDADPWMFLYRVDRQGNLLLLWNYEAPAVSGGYFTAVSPPMSEVVDNFDYAYYFIANLDAPPVGEDLRAMEVEVAYVLDTYLPVILRSY
jgi:hypothetical protein